MRPPRRRRRPTRVVVVGEERLVVDALAVWFEESATIDLVGARHGIPMSPPGNGTCIDDDIVADVIVVDVPAGDTEGPRMGLVTAAAEASGGTPVLALVDDASPPTALRVLRAGASAFVPKTATTLELIDAVQRLARGDIRLPASLLGEILRTSDEASADDAELRDGLLQLTPRERDVLQRIVDGLRPAEIAAVLFISTHTVRSHTRGIFTKLGARSHLEAMSLALRGGYRPSSGRASPLRHPYDVATRLEVHSGHGDAAGGPK